MSYIKFKNNNTKYENFILDIIDLHTIKISNLEQNLSGFEIYTDSDNLIGDYSDYKYNYEEPNLGVKVYKYTNDNHKYVAPIYTTTFTSSNGGTLEGTLEQTKTTYSQLLIPNPIPNENYKFVNWSPTIPTSGNITKSEIFVAQFEYVPTLEEVKEQKINDMSSQQQSIINYGVEVELSDGTVERFELTQKNQTDMLGLQLMVASGQEQIPWHNADDAEHCKYYSNTDMANILQKATLFMTYHVTLFRDIRIWINSLDNKEDVESVTYTIPPTEYQSEVLKDLISKMSE